MTRNRTILLVVSALLLAPLAIASFAVAGDPGDDDFFKQFPVFQDVLRLVRQAYVDEVDLSELMAGAFQGLGDALDPFSTLVPSEHVEALRTLSDSPPPSGMILGHGGGVLFVIGLSPGGPAEAAEIKPGDIITEIGGVPTRNLPLWDAELRLSQIPMAIADTPNDGTDDSEAEPIDQGGLSVGILRGGDQWVAKLTQTESEILDLTTTVNDNDLILRLYRPSPSAVEQISTALSEATTSGLSGVLIDLRRAWGSDYNAAIEIAQALGSAGGADFIARNGDRTHVTSAGDQHWGGRVVVLVSRSTHGAGELLARLLANNFQTVGQNSFGYLGQPSWLPVGEGAEMRTADGFFGPPIEGAWNEPLEPEIVVTGRDRRFSQKDQSLEELTEQRGLEALRSEDLERAA